MMPRRPHLLTAAMAAAVALGAAGTARADMLPPLSADQSKSLGHAIRLWSGGLVAGDVGDTPGFTATPADGHYDVAIPVAGKLGTEGAAIEGEPITAKATPRDGGAWLLDDVLLPSPLRFVSPPGKDGKRVTLEQTYGEQVSNVSIDPTLATPTSADTLHGKWRLAVGDSLGPVEMTARTSNTHVEWAPASPGRVDSGMVSKLEDVEVHDQGVGKHRVSATLRSLTTTLQSADADPEAASALVRRAIAFVGGLPSGPAPKTLTPEQRAAVKEMLHAVRTLSREGKQAVDAEGLAVTNDGHVVGIDKIAMTQHVAAPDGKLDFSQRFEVSGLHVPDNMVPPPARPLVPRHFVFAPHVSGVSLDALFAAIEAKIDDPDGKNDEALAKLGKSGGTAALDELAFDLGPATLSAHGRVTGDDPQTLDAAATIEATGFEALLKLAQSQPMLKQGVPVLIYLKGIGNQDGAKVVWDVAYKAGAFTVNGTDMSSLIPGK